MSRIYSTASDNWRRWPNADIEAYIARYEGLDTTQHDEDLIQLLDDMEQELMQREEYLREQDDTPSLQDQGFELGSYGS